MINNWIRDTLRKVGRRVKRKKSIKKPSKNKVKSKITKLSKTKIARREKYLQYKEVARVLVLERLAIYNQIYQYKYNRISIRDQKTRWGSCSSKGNINFNYKIALLPTHLADYIVVHELCHVGEMNHSSRFWDLVARTIPNYLECRAQLKSIKL